MLRHDVEKKDQLITELSSFRWVFKKILTLRKNIYFQFLEKINTVDLRQQKYEF